MRFWAAITHNASNYVTEDVSVTTASNGIWLTAIRANPIVLQRGETKPAEQLGSKVDPYK